VHAVEQRARPASLDLLLQDASQQVDPMLEIAIVIANR
jgi:hypothetical protein